MPSKRIYIIRTPSGSGTKVGGIHDALKLEYPDLRFRVRGIPVELQKQDTVPAQPEGRHRTIAYTYLREKALQRKSRGQWDLDIAIESGKVGSSDVAFVLFTLPSGRKLVVASRKIIMPSRFIAIARRRGFDTTTVGDVIHEQYPHIPSGDWQAYATSLERGDNPPLKEGMSRREQIAETVARGLRKLKPFG